MRKTISTKPRKRIAHAKTLFMVALLVFSDLLPDLLFSQQKSSEWRGLEGKTLEYEMETEQDLGKEIRQVIFSETTKEAPARPKYIRRRALSGEEKSVGDNLIAADNFQSVRIISKGGRFIISDQGNFYGWKRPVGERTDWTIPMRVTFYRAPNEMLWEKDYEKEYDSRDLSFVISNSDGSVVEINSISGQVKFYDPNAKIVNRHKLFNTAGYREGGITGRFTENGEYFVAKATADDGSTYRYGSAVILFTKDGKKLWTFEPREAKGFFTIWPSPDASFIVSYNYLPGKEEATYLLDRKGNLVQKFPGLYTSYAAFSESREYVVLNNPYNEVNLIRCQTGEKVMRYNVGALSVDISEELGVVAILQGSVRGQTVTNHLAKLTNGKITVLNFNGVPAWELNLPVIEAPQIAAKLSLSGDGRTIGVMLASTYREYKLQE